MQGQSASYLCLVKQRPSKTQRITRPKPSLLTILTGHILILMRMNLDLTLQRQDPTTVIRLVSLHRERINIKNKLYRLYDRDVVYKSDLKAKIYKGHQKSETI